MNIISFIENLGERNITLSIDDERFLQRESARREGRAPPNCLYSLTQLSIIIVNCKVGGKSC